MTASEDLSMLPGSGLSLAPHCHLAWLPTPFTSPSAFPSTQLGLAVHSLFLPSSAALRRPLLRDSLCKLPSPLSHEGRSCGGLALSVPRPAADPRLPSLVAPDAS